METNLEGALASGTPSSVDLLWILIAAALVFFMQAGFKVLETGLVKHEHRPGVGVKNLMDWVAGSLVFFLVGFGFMFGPSGSGLIGKGYFLGLDLTDHYTLIFFLFQLAFAGTSLTIVSGAMSGRTGLLPYFMLSIFTAVVIYPIFGYWAWGNLLHPENEPWLASLGFMDFAGSTVVHSVGAWVSVVGIWMVGPRIGRYSASGKVQPMKSSDYSYSILGVMILWFGWFGFNGGSTLAFNADVPLIILNTNLAAAASAVSAYMHAKFVQKNKDVMEKIIGGSLTGLVAITACCNVVSPQNSIIIGLLAGLVHNYAYVFLSEKLKLDDPVGAIPVHGFGGVFGTLCVALFGKAELLANPRWTQLAVQAFGILVCMAFTFGMAFIVLFIVKKFFGLRVSPKAEMDGSVFEDGDSNEVEMADEVEQTVSQVSVRISDRSYNLYHVREYLNLPRETRMKLIKSDGVQYLDESGNLVEPLKAVRYLSGIVEGQRNEAITEKDIVGKSITQTQSEMIGSMQDVLIGEESNIVSVFPDSFVMLLSKGKVSSEFFWHTKEKGYRFAVVAACSDEGISSAFLSAISISLLNEIVGVKKVLPPEKILGYLDQKLIVALQQSNKQIKDARGLEIGIIVVDTYNRKYYYSAAGSRIKLYHKLKDDGITEYKGIDIPLGKQTSKPKNFERTTNLYTPGDALYLCTDGYSNQLNSQGKRFSHTQLKEKLTANASKSMLEQKLLLSFGFDDWKGNEEQVEDALIMGIKP